MKNQKAQSSISEPILLVGAIIISLFFLVIALKDQYFSMAELKDRGDSLVFFERGKSIINSLNTAESGEVVETLFGPKEIELFSNSTGNYFSVEGKVGKISTQVQATKVKSDKIKFVKNKGKPIEVRGV